MKGYFAGWKRLDAWCWVSWTCFCCSAFLQLTSGCSRKATFPAAADANALIAELTALQATFRFPAPDPSCTHLAYVRSLESGRRLFILDLANGRSLQLPVTNDVSRIYGWSPDHRFLAFEQSPPLMPSADGSLSATWITLYDTESGEVKRIGTNAAVSETSATWLGGCELFYSSQELRRDYAEKFIVNLRTRTTRKVRNYLNDFILTGPDTAVFFGNGNLQTCRLDTTNYPRIQPLSSFPPHEFDLFRWLQFRSNTASFCFCARKTNSEWRCLYEFDPASRQLRQLTTQNTYNGQCLGNGYAWVGNTNNEFFIAVRPADSSLATNLFMGGEVLTFSASADGNKLYAIASEKAEPQSLWEYNVLQRRLRKLVDGHSKPWQAARQIEPQAFTAKSFDSLEIPFFVLPPADLPKDHSSSKIFPVVLYLPAATWQFQYGFDSLAEFYANLNCWFVAVNYRGVDGYGRTYNDLGNTANAAKDALGALTFLAKNAQVDSQRVMLISESSGADVSLELLKNSGRHWRGAVFQHPVFESETADSLSQETPPLLVVAGRLERFLPEAAQFVEAAKKIGIPAQLHIQKNTGHMVWSTDEIRETLQAEWAFTQQNLE